MERIYLKLTVLATGWGAGILLLAAAGTIASRRWQRTTAATVGLTLLGGIALYALLPLR